MTGRISSPNAGLYNIDVGDIARLVQAETSSPFAGNLVNYYMGKKGENLDAYDRSLSQTQAVESLMAQLGMQNELRKTLIAHGGDPGKSGYSIADVSGLDDLLMPGAQSRIGSRVGGILGQAAQTANLNNLKTIAETQKTRVDAGLMEPTGLTAAERGKPSDVNESIVNGQLVRRTRNVAEEQRQLKTQVEILNQAEAARGSQRRFSEIKESNGKYYARDAATGQLHEIKQAKK